MTVIRKIFIFCILLLLFATSMSGKNFTVEIKPAADTHISKLYKGSCFGKKKFLRAGHDNKGKKMVSLLRFRLPVLKGKLVKAELILYKCYQKPKAKGVTKVSELKSSWAEKTVCWKNQPQFDYKPFYTGVPVAGDPIGKYSIDITSIVEKWYKDSSKNFGICIFSDAYGYAKQLKFHSRENKFPPVLKITTTEKLDPLNLQPVNTAFIKSSKDKIALAQKKKVIADFKRPPFSKENYKGTVWSEANPWFRPSQFSVTPTNTYGGPDFAWDYFSTNEVEMWKEIAEKYHKYGITGLQFEILNNAGFINNFKQAAAGFELSGRKLRIMPFLSIGSPTPEKMIKNIGKTLDKLSYLIKEDSVWFKIDGHPVISLYSAASLSADDWKLVIHTLEKKYGRIIWLFNAVHHKFNAKKIREYLKAFDGITMYGNWGTKGQKKCFDKLAPIMHKEFPEKIFEVATHTNYTVHFHYGGYIPKLTTKFRESWENALEAKPDSITVTNWFDVYENSRIMPSYELDDIRLKTVQYYSNLWKKAKTKTSSGPDLYLANFTNILLGQNLQFEVISFPVKKSGELYVSVELCNAKGETLHEFPFKKLNTSKLDSAFYEVAALKFKDNKAVLPRIKYKWNNKVTLSNLLPQTNLVTSMRPHLLYWCRGLKHQLHMNGLKPWRINATAQGGNLVLKPGELSVLHGYGCSTNNGQANSGGNWIRILRNGREIKNLKTLLPWGINMAIPMQLPNPTAALDWYNIELVRYDNGCRYITPPIWVTSGERKGLVQMPVWDMNDAAKPIKDIQIEAVRVPFFYYECALPAGRMILDTSGYDHHGLLGNKKVSAKHLQKTLYRHEHTGYSVNLGNGAKVGNIDYPKYSKDAEGAYLDFNGESYAMLRGGTAFPYASTFELFIKPAATNKDEDILGAANNQIRISRLADGRIKIFRSGAIEGEGGDKPAAKGRVEITSKSIVPVGKWTHIAAVYDLEKLSLYVNGKLEGEAKIKPMKSHEWISSVVVGGNCSFPFNAKPSFKGGIKKVRIYGRNLSPKEFLTKYN